MTLDEAIKILDQEYNYRLILNQIEACNAFRLGIEALRLIKKDRDGSYHLLPLLLPGETEE